MNQKKLLNKNIIISAAADGIGWSIAELCMNNGSTVFISDINEDKLSLIKKHKNYNSTLFIKKVNANDPEDVLNYFSELKNKITTIDGLINNVGIAGPTGKIEELDIEQWKNTIDVNINSHFYFSKYSIPYLKKNGGSIINLSSTAGLFGFPLRTPYAASKWAIIGLTKSLAMELGKHKIRVNAICPGSVKGQRMQRVINSKAKLLKTSPSKIKKEFESMTSIPSFVTKADIASMVVYLLSDQSNNISGQSISIDGNTERMS